MAYNKSEKFLNNIEKVKSDHTPTGINQIYWNEFATNSGKKESSLLQYKSAVNRFTTYIEKDSLEVSISDITNYLETVKEGKTRENAERYIKSFLTYTITNNIEKAVNITSADTILSLVPTEYKNLIKILMMK